MELLAAGKHVRIHQIQLEQVSYDLHLLVSRPEYICGQDTGKSMFDSRRRLSSIDLNRAGTGLMEIVSEPDMRFVAMMPSFLRALSLTIPSSPEEAGEYVRTLQALLRSVGSSDGNMEQVPVHDLIGFGVAC